SRSLLGDALELPGLSDAIIQVRQHIENTAQGVKQDLATAADGISSSITTTLSATTARAVQSLDYTVAQAEGVTNGIAHELWHIVAADFGRWLGHHPVLAWLLAHPLVTLGLGVVIVVLVGGLIQAMAQLAQRGWTALLNIPLYLIRLSVKGLRYLLRRTMVGIGDWYRRYSSSRPMLNTVMSSPLAPQEEPMSNAAAVSNGHSSCLRNEDPTHLLDAATLTDIQNALQHQSQVTDDRQLLEVLKRLEYLGQEQTLALQHLISLLEKRASSQKTHG
ncbi:MAG: hypothetical protein WBA10_17525, partial [Elainellaceae cyanobacterium]